jgi:hypothetical protein
MTSGHIANNVKRAVNKLYTVVPLKENIGLGLRVLCSSQLSEIE